MCLRMSSAVKFSSQVTNQQAPKNHIAYITSKYFLCQKLHTYYVENIVSCKNEINPLFDIACTVTRIHNKNYSEKLCILSAQASSLLILGVHSVMHSKTFYVHVKSFIESPERLMFFWGSTYPVRNFRLIL